MTEILNLKLVITYEFLNTKIFLLKDAHQIGLKKFLQLKILKIKFHGHTLLMILKVKKSWEHFMQKYYKKIQDRKGDYKKRKSYLLKGKVTIVYLIAGLIKKIQCNSNV